jgi:hypothetical protein
LLEVLVPQDIFITLTQFCVIGKMIGGTVMFKYSTVD